MTVPVFGEQGEESRPPLAVGIVGLEKDEWEVKFHELHEPTTVPLPAAEDQPPPPSLTAQPPGYTRDTTVLPLEDPGALSATAVAGTQAQATVPGPELPIASRGLEDTPLPPPVTGPGSAKRRVNTPVRAKRERLYKCLTKLAFGQHRGSCSPLCYLQYRPAGRLPVSTRSHHLGLRVQPASKRGYEDIGSFWPMERNYQPEHGRT